MAAFTDIPADEWQKLADALDVAIDELSPEQQAVAVDRAARRTGVRELDPGDERHLRILWDELRAAALRAALARLVAQGELEVGGVAANGHLIHRPRAASNRSRDA